MAGVAVFRVARDLRYEWAFNQQFDESREGLVGKRNSEIFLPEEAALLDGLFSEAFDSGLPQTVDVRLRCLKSEREHLVEILLDPARTEDGYIEALTGAAIDLSPEVERYHELINIRTQADDARTRANDARTQANDARTQADDARTQAKDVRTQADDARTQAKDVRTQADDARAQADDVRIQADDARAQADDVRTQADDARTQANDVRTQADDARTQAKDARTQADDARALAEDALAQADDARALAKDVRSRADDARALAEDLRTQADDARTQADDARTQADDARTQARDVRTQADDARAQAKDVRTQADDARAQAEDLRTRADDARVQAEDLRTQADDARAQAEDLRTQADDARTQAEDALTQADDARAQAEEANRNKTRLLASTGHDLRQPLQAMVFFQSMVQDRLSFYGDEKGVEAAKAIAHALSSAEELLTSLTDLATVESGEIAVHVKEFTADTVVGRNVKNFDAMAAAKGLRLRIRPCAEMIRSDPVLLKRIVRNLTINAIKYTDRGGILVGCRRRGNSLRIDVWDTGRGIPENKIGEIFNEFYRGDEVMDPGGGLGIGLTIVARIARRLDHKITVRSREGKGALFAVTVPLA